MKTKWNDLLTVCPKRLKILDFWFLEIDVTTAERVPESTVLLATRFHRFHSQARRKHIQTQTLLGDLKQKGATTIPLDFGDNPRGKAQSSRRDILNSSH